jgi:2-hydroxy-6-oxonona-2,4-dienedioate hydrolase
VKPPIEPDEIIDIPGTADAAPVVLLPGMIAGKWMWGATPDLLSQAGYRVVVFCDPIGFVAGTISAMTDNLAAHLDRMSIGKATLLGASLGSAVALTYAARNPERVESMMLSGAPTMTGNQQLGIASFGKLTKGIAFSAADRLLYDRSCIDDGVIEQTFLQFLDKRRFINVVRLMRESSEFDTIGALEQIDVDTLMIWGEDDKISKCEDWQRILPYVKRGTFVKIARCGHSPMVEQPAEFNRILMEFLARQLTRRTAR